MNGIDARAVERLVREALREDGAERDATIALLGIGREVVSARIVAREDAVVAGTFVASAVFSAMDEKASIESAVGDGGRIATGETLMRVEGAARAILAGERVALNFLQRLCGIATLAGEFVERVRGTGVTILDTRKTTPLWRDLEKYAVRCGGAENHRRDLGAMVLVKENHVRVLGGRQALLSRIPAAGKDAGFVEVEVDSIEFLDELLGAPIDRVMLDNFSPDGVREALERIGAHRRARSGRRLEVEVSGGVTLDNVADFAVPGVDFISVGALTHSAPSIDLSLEVQ